MTTVTLQDMLISPISYILTQCQVSRIRMELKRHKQNWTG